MRLDICLTQNSFTSLANAVQPNFYLGLCNCASDSLTSHITDHVYAHKSSTKLQHFTFVFPYRWSMNLFTIRAYKILQHPSFLKKKKK